MENSLEEILREVDGELRAVEERIRCVHERVRTLMASGGLKPRDPDLWKVIEDGRTRYVTEQELEDLCQSPKHDLILHGPKMMLRLPERGEKKKQKKDAWVPISWPDYKILLVGMSRPGWPFGNRSVMNIFPVDLGVRSLTRYMANVTELVQDGGTKGPYVRAVSSVAEASDSGRGYVFNADRHYLVVCKKR